MIRSKFVALPVALALGFAMVGANPALAARTDPNPTPSELAHAATARQAGTEGAVLLDNPGAGLPVPTSQPIALYGVGAYKTVKGGTGSGDVNNRYTITVRQGLEAAGYTLTQSPDYWDAMVYKIDNLPSGGGGFMGGSIDYAAGEVALTEATVQPTAPTDTALFVVARNSGEGADRSSGAGDYLLTDTELANLKLLGETYKKVAVILNVGAVVDTQFFKTINAAVSDPWGGPALDTLLLMSQLGQEGGHALADLVSGAVNPSGKTVDTWASAYSYYPAAGAFANQDGISNQEDYNEGVYVGYRYFDSFYKSLNPSAPESVVNYPFGHGLSYTTFSVTTDSVTADADAVTVKATVANTGSVPGKQVVQVYFSAPTAGLDKPYQELAAYAKTDTLDPGKAQQLTLSFNTTEMSSYDEAIAAYTLKAGNYVIRVGASSRDTSAEAVLSLTKTIITEQLANEVTDQRVPAELTSDPAAFYTYPGEAAQIAAAPRVALDPAAFTTADNASPYQQSVTIPTTSPFHAVDGETIGTATALINASSSSKWEGTGAPYAAKEGETTQTVAVTGTPTLYDVVKGDATWNQLVASLSVEQLANIVQGGSTGTPSTLRAEGAAGYTTALYESLGIASMTLPDGPAGIRITQEYTAGGTTYYQYATDVPIGTALAQTWNRALIGEIGELIGAELGEYGGTLWLAPGMNIHRDPLNGRNFEYYSEDPLVSGLTAAAETAGVQATPGVGVTLKHYAGNNQETSRSGGNSTINERALREIYLKGFEIAVKSAQPMAIMSSYNKINGTCVAGDYDLLTDLLRGEWDFAGLVMTDWGGCGPFLDNMYAGNDLIEPGGAVSASILSILQTEPNIDRFGLPAWRETAGMGWGGAPGATTFSIDSGNFAMAAGGSLSRTTTVDSSIIGATLASGTASGGGWGGGAVTVTPRAPFTSVQEAYEHVETLLSATDQHLTAAQKAAVTVSDVVGAPPAVTEFKVTFTGDFSTPMRLGDMQRSAQRILKTVSQSAPFAELAQIQGVSGITVVPYTSQFTDLATYVTASAGAVTDAPEPVDPPAQSKDALATAIAVAQAVTSSAAFTPATWAALQSALAAAQDVVDNPAATQAEVDAASAAVLDALGALAPSDATAAIEATLDAIQASIAALDAARGADRTALLAAIAALQRSIAALAAVPGHDFTAMEAALAAIQKSVAELAGGGQAPVAKPAVKAGTVQISGTAKVGKKLSAKTAKWTAGVKYTYKWYANGKAIKQAKAKSLKLTKAQAGKKITVKVKAKKAGHTSASKTSKATKRVKK
ncbi:MAG: glycoside hydrolase family 3 C-terminal domain-containing protein [Bifidobacteriaceae bacterium]|nr:glycoside hydrolase family 3 C-terminal domain-containing protein [Bifidobacteriaceae bacterium]